MVIVSLHLSPCFVVFNCCPRERLASKCIFTLVEADLYHHVLLQVITMLKARPELHMFTFPGFIFKKLRTKWVYAGNL